MGGQAQPGLARHVEGIGEVARAADAFLAGDAEADQPVIRGLGGADGGALGGLGAEMADAGDDAAQDRAPARLGDAGSLSDRGQRSRHAARSLPPQNSGDRNVSV